MGTLLDQPRPVREGEELDRNALQQWLAGAVPNNIAITDIHQFPSGFSNLTYLIKGDTQEMILRRPPKGSKVKSAHDMHREFRILSALNPVYPAAPKPLAYCDDASIIGAPFYVMERIEGVILRGKKPKEFDGTPELATTLCKRFVDNLAHLHAVDYEAIGLADLRREGSFTRRQVDGWIDRYRGSQTDDIPAIEQLAAYLKKNIPEDTDTVFIHNDYKFDNIVLDPDDLTRIIGVLDWEMCTIGDPLMDLGVVLSYWNEPKDISIGMVPCFLTLEPGCMTRQEVVNTYGERTERDVSNIMFYYIFGLLKLAVIAQQIYYRYKQGLTKDERFAGLIYVVGALGMTGIKALDTNEI
jgi:aminoglycoside phosphotransferase (APT) family kinase protein